MSAGLKRAGQSTGRLGSVCIVEAVRRLEVPGPASWMGRNGWLQASQRWALKDFALSYRIMRVSLNGLDDRFLREAALTVANYAEAAGCREDARALYQALSAGGDQAVHPLGRMLNVSDFRALIQHNRVCVVGSGNALNGHGLGPQIDDHDVVVRLNGQFAPLADRGARTHIHVIDNSGGLQIDLQSPNVVFCTPTAAHWTVLAEDACRQGINVGLYAIERPVTESLVSQDLVTKVSAFVVRLGPKSCKVYARGFGEFVSNE